MADNVKVQPATAVGSITVKTDDIGGVHWPAYKIAYGADGSATEVDATNPLPVTGIAPTSIAHGVQAVTTATTRVNLATNTAKSITIKATAANTGTIYVGGSGVTAANGFPLLAGDTLSLDISNTDKIWLDSSVNGESAAWISNA